MLQLSLNLAEVIDEESFKECTGLKYLIAPCVKTISTNAFGEINHEVLVVSEYQPQ
jgi:hypothetical protein